MTENFLHAFETQRLLVEAATSGVKQQPVVLGRDEFVGGRCILPCHPGRWVSKLTEIPKKTNSHPFKGYNMPGDAPAELQRCFALQGMKPILGFKLSHDTSCKLT